MWLDPGSHQLFDDEPPARAALDGERDVVATVEPLQPIPQRWPCGRADLARGHLTRVRVYVVERDLCSMHVKATYNCHLRPPRAPVLCKINLACAEGVSSHAIFPELGQAARSLPAGTLLDGEIVIADEA